MRSVYRTAAGGAEISVEDYFSISVYYPILDNIVSDVELRFGPTQRKAAMTIGTTDDEEWAQLQDAVNVYRDLIIT